jgi:hypothetical protein
MSQFFSLPGVETLRVTSAKTIKHLSLTSQPPDVKKVGVHQSIL